MAAGAVLVLPFRLSRYLHLDTDTVKLMPDPPTVTSVHDDDGPILLSAEWQIDPERRDQFIAAMEPVRIALKRQGALSFHLVEEVNRPGHMLESFTVATWAEYQRLPERVTMTEKAIHDALMAASGSEPPALLVHREINLKTRQTKEKV